MIAGTFIFEDLSVHLHRAIGWEAIISCNVTGKQKTFSWTDTECSAILALSIDPEMPMPSLYIIAENAPGQDSDSIFRLFP